MTKDLILALFASLWLVKMRRERGRRREEEEREGGGGRKGGLNLIVYQ